MISREAPLPRTQVLNRERAVSWQAVQRIAAGAEGTEEALQKHGRIKRQLRGAP